MLLCFVWLYTCFAPHLCCAVQVSSCLASIAQGMNTKSRAWVTRKNGQQQQQQCASQQGAADPFAQSPFHALMGDSAAAAAAADVAAGSLMDGLLGLSRGAIGGPTAVVLVFCSVLFCLALVCCAAQPLCCS